MIAAADVRNINCCFVKSVLSLVNKQAYSVDLCFDNVYEKFKNHALADTLGECLDYNQECVILNDSKDCAVVTDVTVVAPVLTPCTSQLSLDSSVNTSSCTYSASVVDPYSGSPYCRITLVDDSIYYNGELVVKMVNSCDSTTSSHTVTGGVTSSGSSDSYKGKLRIGLSTSSSDIPYLANNGYLQNIRVYETDAFGILTNTPIDLDVDPNTSPYYTASGSCPGCTTVSSTDVLFGSPNFLTAINTVMNNVSLARYGETGHHNMAFGYSGGTLTVACDVKHNPAEQHFGVHQPDKTFTWYHPATGTRRTRSSTAPNYTLYTPLRFYDASLSFSIPCGTLAPDLLDQAVILYPDLVNTSFNKISLASPYGTYSAFIPYPFVLSGTTSSACTSYTISIVTSTTGSAIDTIEWYLGETLVDEDTNSITVTTTGTYTVVVTLENGCEITYNIQVPSGNTILIEPS